MKIHGDKYHDSVVSALKKIVLETPKDDVVFAIQALIDSLTAPGAGGRTTLDLLWNRDNMRLSAEALALVWFLDGHIAFHQFDNPLFKKLIETISGTPLPSSFTFVETHLPILYDYVTTVQRKWLGRSRAFWSSCDIWTRMGKKFLSQTYHLITFDTFEYRAMCLDLVILLGAAYGTSIASVLERRQEFWTHELQIIAAGGVADGGSNVQNALEFLFGDEEGVDDREHCQNHNIKGTYEAIEAGCTRLKDDLDAVSELFVNVAHSSCVNQILKSYRYIHDIGATSFYLVNETRWEGRQKNN
jgi:hypothetical protein